MRTQALVFLCLITVTGSHLSGQQTGKEPAELLHNWREKTASDAMQRVRLELISKYWTDVADIPAETASPGFIVTLNIVRNGLNWRINQRTAHDEANTADDGPTRSRREILITDQLLTIRGDNGRVPLDQFVPKASGQLEVDPSMRESPGLVLMAGFVFGWGMSRNTSLTLPGQMLEASRLTSYRNTDGTRVVEATIERAEISVRFNGAAHGLPVAITEKTERHDGKVLDISWELNDGVWIPVRYTLVTSRIGRPSKKDVQRCSVSSFDADISTSESDFLPTWEIPEGHPVLVDTVPFECEWRGERIVPSIAENAGLTNARIGRRSVSWTAGFWAVGIIGLVGAAIMAWKRSTDAAR